MKREISLRVAKAATQAKVEPEVIAAAPELLKQRDALLDALEFYLILCGNTGYSISRESAQEAYDKARAAIALCEKGKR